VQGGRKSALLDLVELFLEAPANHRQSHLLYLFGRDRRHFERDLHVGNRNRTRKLALPGFDEVLGLDVA
jgi:hypothetical protein